MSIRIERLKIRMPAGTSVQPKTFARQIAQGLAAQSQGVAPMKADTLQLRLNARTGDMATPIADALGRALRSKAGN